MSMRFSFVILSIICCLHAVHLVTASPPINIRRLYESAREARANKDDLSFPQPDEDVLELEQLKQKPVSEGIDLAENVSREESLPNLQRQLEFEVTKDALNLGQPEEEEKTILQFRPQHNLQQTKEEQSTKDFATSGSANTEKLPDKPFYGAARLTYGQNPDTVPTSSISPSTPSSTTESPSTSTTTTAETTATTTSVASSLAADSKKGNFDSETNSNDSLSAELELTRNGERRSLHQPLKKASEIFVKSSNGQYSPFDMAQYVFWTGDENGVARAVEEFIQDGLMTHENAIKFLRDIRIGIEYLQNSYNNRMLSNYYKEKEASTSSTSTSTIQPSATERPQDLIYASPTLNPSVQKALERLPSLFRLQEINNERSKDNNVDYDEMAGRMRIADFLYAEYPLEEVIYQLAKVMFSQSLTHGSEQAQNALQRLTGFLEVEGLHGRISPALQKKILDVLLAALSDTLAEHPELLAAARSGLGTSFHQLPKHIIESTKH